MTPRSWKVATVTLVVLTVVAYIHEIISRVPAYRWLHSQKPFYVAESIDKLLGVAICLLAMWLINRVGVGALICELGLSAETLPAIAFALTASLPMLISFALSCSLSPHIEIRSVLFLTVLSPIVEEIEFRGFGFRQLQRGTGWPFG